MRPAGLSGCANGCVGVGIVAFLGAWLAGWATFEWGATVRYLDARASSQWPTVRGTVVSSGIGVRKGRGGPTFWPEVTYRYSVDSKDYTGRQITFDGSMGHRDRPKAQSIIAPYPRDAQVTVYYKPGDPSQAILEPGASSYVATAPLIGAAGGLLFLAVFVILPVYHFRRTAKAKRVEIVVHRWGTTDFNDP